jgi:hypothetical protein
VALVVISISRHIKQVACAGSPDPQHASDCAALPDQEEARQRPFRDFADHLRRWQSLVALSWGQQLLHLSSHELHRQALGAERVALLLKQPQIALAPFRARAFQRPEGDPASLAYLDSAGNRAGGGFDVTLEVLLASRRMREAGCPAVRLSRGNLSVMY